MSAPDTNLEKQARRHRPAIWGIAVALAVAAVAAIVFVMRDGVPAEDQAAAGPAGSTTEVAE